MVTGRPEKFELDTEVGALPIINHFCERLALTGLLEAFLPHDDARLKLAPASAIGVMARSWNAEVFLTRLTPFKATPRNSLAQSFFI